MSDAALDLEPVESPCTGVCRLDHTGHCQGCMRSATEIAEWLSYTPQQRREIMQVLPERSAGMLDDG